MVHGFELDDVVQSGMTHGGTVVVPAALAMAEHCSASAERFLLGVVAGYETIARVGAALGEETNTRGLHTTGFAGAVAAAVAAGVVAGMPYETIARAVGIACSSASGIKAFTQGGGMVKRLHGGRAAESGVLACLLAERGFTGPVHAIDGRFGLLEVYAGEHARPDALAAGLGEVWAVGRVWIKMYPCCALIHSTVQALETIRHRERLDAAAIGSVRVGACERAAKQNGDRSPKETMSAQYSVPFCAALALTGDVRDPGSFATKRLHDPALRAMLDRVSLYCDPEMDAVFPESFGGRVEVTLTDGRRFTETVLSPHGTPADPCDEADIVQKFRTLCTAVSEGFATESLLQAILGLANGGSIAVLSKALRAVRVQPQD